MLSCFSFKRLFVTFFERNVNCDLLNSLTHSLHSPSVDRKDSLGFANRWRPLFEAYVKLSQWFLGAELFVAIATAVLAGLVPADGNVTVCANLQKASCFLSLCFFAVVASKRPYSVPFDFWLAVLNAGLTALSCVLGLIDVDTVDLSNAQIGLNFAGTVVFLLSFLLEGNLNKLNGRIVRVLRGDAPRHRSASNIEADPSPVPHQTLVYTSSSSKCTC